MFGDLNIVKTLLYYEHTQFYMANFAQTVKAGATQHKGTSISIVNYECYAPSESFPYPHQCQLDKDQEDRFVYPLF